MCLEYGATMSKSYEDPVDGMLLLYAVAALPVRPAKAGGWFHRSTNGVASIISRHEDVPDVLLRLPQDWTVLEPVKFVGLHDDPDIVSVDPRFRYSIDRRSSAIVGRNDGGRHVLLMLVNSPEAALMPQRLFGAASTFEDCLCYLDQTGRL
ncbi:hypothetical protein AWB79_06184 [Caballeronia hypogeia]|uniref:Uncharacterized protein n=1 Tax=Caballeronia hypogeia TaxID=1777140 RepID=A0A158CYI3_9BURK|nr:hypothetical protein AWB79_06184 [Caballeronia hypogeia]